MPSRSRRRHGSKPAGSRGSSRDRAARCRNPFHCLTSTLFHRPLVVLMWKLSSQRRFCCLRYLGSVLAFASQRMRSATEIFGGGAQSSLAIMWPRSAAGRPLRAFRPLALNGHPGETFCRHAIHALFVGKRDEVRPEFCSDALSGAHLADGVQTYSQPAGHPSRSANGGNHGENGSMSAEDNMSGTKTRPNG